MGAHCAGRARGAWPLGAKRALYSPATRAQRQSLERDELEKITAWKLRRGKFRPRLQQLVAQNSEAAVREQSTAALRAAADAARASTDEAFAAAAAKAVQALCVLRGVGPATASAVLALAAPRAFGFMADETLTTVLRGPFKYSEAECSALQLSLRVRARELGDALSPHELSQALWASSVLAAPPRPPAQGARKRQAAPQEAGADADAEDSQQQKKRTRVARS